MAATAAACLLSVLAVQVPAHADQATRQSGSEARAGDDFNGDGYRDLAIGTPDATVNGRAAAGSVVISYGTPQGIDPARRTVITQDSSFIPGAAETSDKFGTSISSGDLDGDGYADLVVGSPGEDISEGPDQGSVSVIWGGANGPTGSRTLTGRSSDSSPGEFGRTVVVGRFTGDGKPDVAVAGYTDVWLASDITKAGDAKIDHIYAYDLGPFHHKTIMSGTSGDANGDGRDELVVFGQTAYTALFTQVNDEFQVVWWEFGLGSAGDFGDINHDGYEDLVLGMPYMDDETGRAQIWWGDSDGFGGPDGPDPGQVTTLSQYACGLGDSELGDQFGHTVRLYDANRDGFGDLAVTAPYENAKDGAVWRLPGTANGLTAVGSQSFDPPRLGVNSPGARFGLVLNR
ncbi:hypothetical protein AQ490_24555 [Wenjunlia vitaminophila]|uniref:Integrin-like protein n=1 Tax=Wenjunlia vitaminophila TaxID=76728 RepID=A0A0T6LRQ7_WENVI|nr:FG-GAP-like repeat-containing protein [Wenjunlia vitaminophila]KRV48577.1 hypothetical protein AQ490_24555 [Wenjunlia vitaminophila]